MQTDFSKGTKYGRERITKVKEYYRNSTLEAIDSLKRLAKTSNRKETVGRLSIQLEKYKNILIERWNKMRKPISICRKRVKKKVHSHKFIIQLDS